MDNPVNEVVEQPFYVNAKQYHRILKRRVARAKLEESLKVARGRKPYLHESRHKHAMRRPRGQGGRFLTAAEIAEKERKEAEEKNGQPPASEEGSHPTNDVSDNILNEEIEARNSSINVDKFINGNGNGNKSSNGISNSTGNANEDVDQSTFSNGDVNGNERSKYRSKETRASDVDGDIEVNVDIAADADLDGDVAITPDGMSLTNGLSDEVDESEVSHFPEKKVEIEEEEKLDF